VVVAIATASGFLNARPAASAEPVVAMSFSLLPVALEVRAAGLAIEIKI
jgi:hypothetical protein